MSIIVCVRTCVSARERQRERECECVCVCVCVRACVPPRDIGGQKAIDAWLHKSTHGPRDKRPKRHESGRRATTVNSAGLRVYARTRARTHAAPPAWAAISCSPPSPPQSCRATRTASVKRTPRAFRRIVPRPSGAPTSCCIMPGTYRPLSSSPPSASLPVPPPPRIAPIPPAPAPAPPPGRSASQARRTRTLGSSAHAPPAGPCGPVRADASSPVRARAAADEEHSAPPPGRPPGPHPASASSTAHTAARRSE